MGWLAVWSWVGAFFALKRQSHKVGGSLIALGVVFGGPEILAAVLMKSTSDSFYLFGA